MSQSGHDSILAYLGPQGCEGISAERLAVGEAKIAVPGRERLQTRHRTRVNVGYGTMPARSVSGRRSEEPVPPRGRIAELGGSVS